MRFVVGAVSEIAPGEIKIVFPDGSEEGIGVFNVDGDFFALRNVCPHMGAPLCRGTVTGTAEAVPRDDGVEEVTWTRAGEIVACPWHHWEFEIKTGRTIFPSRSRVRRYPVSLESAEVAARLQRGAETIPVLVQEAIVILELPDS
jgi:nitrite reductase (NADH) small subunit